MDDIIEFILELILEGSIELSKSRKAPMVLRVLAAAILVILLAGLVVLFVGIVWECWQSGNVIATIIVALIGTAALSGVTYLVWKEYMEMKTKDDS